MDFTISRSRRLQALDKAYLPSPRAKRLILRSHLTKTTRIAKLSPYKQTSIKRIGKKSQLDASPKASFAQIKGHASAANSPAHKDFPGFTKAFKAQIPSSISTTMNQSGTLKVGSTSSLHKSASRPESQIVFPGVATKEDTEFPMTAGQVLKRFIQSLTEYEQAEILEFKQVYFFGLGAVKVTPSFSLPNSGYDDDRADYIIVTGDHIAYRYEILDILGKGSFGVVLRCIDHKRKEIVAIKIIRNKRKFHQQGMVEVKVLEVLRDSDLDDEMGIVKMKAYFLFRKHICMVFELLSINLYEFLKVNGFQGVSMGLLKRFAVQLMMALRFTHGLGIIHCDLKPENVLLRSSTKSSIKVIDFGSACFKDTRIYTYIQSRFYRAPEIILGISYGPPIDMWSLGCIVAELARGYPLFPGETELEQLQYIVETLGYPPEHILEISTRTSLFFDSEGHIKLTTNSRGQLHLPSTKSLSHAIHSPDPLFLDFVTRCLEWDPSLRMTAEEGLTHEWIMESGKTVGVSVRETRRAKVRRKVSVGRTGVKAVN